MNESDAQAFIDRLSETIPERPLAVSELGLAATRARRRHVRRTTFGAAGLVALVVVLGAAASAVVRTDDRPPQPAGPATSSTASPPPTVDSATASRIDGEWTALIPGKTAADGAELTDTFGDLDLALTLDRGEARGFDGCNYLYGSFATEGKDLRFHDLATEQASCARSAPLYGILERVRHVSVYQDQFYLHAASYEIILVLSPR